MIEVVNIRQHWEASFGESLADVIRGFASDGESPRAIAEILRVEPGFVRRFMARHRIRVDRSARLPREQTADAQRKKAESIRRRNGRDPVRWRGQTWTFPQLQAATGIPADTIRMRINHGWPVGRALTRDVMTPREIGQLTARSTR